MASREQRAGLVRPTIEPREASFLVGPGQKTLDVRRKPPRPLGGKPWKAARPVARRSCVRPIDAGPVATRSGARVAGTGAQQARRGPRARGRRSGSRVRASRAARSRAVISTRPRARDTRTARRQRPPLRARQTRPRPTPSRPQLPDRPAIGRTRDACGGRSGGGARQPPGAPEPRRRSPLSFEPHGCAARRVARHTGAECARKER